MSFRKRKIVTTSCLSTPIVDVSTSEDGQRDTRLVNEEDYFKLHPISYESFTLTEQLQAGVPLKEVDCSTLLNDDHRNCDIDEETEILANLESQVNNPENNNSND